MNLTFLKYFSDAAREKSVLKSAHLNFVSSAAISNGIRKLEAELNVELFKHGKNKIELTKEGISLLKSSEAIFKMCENVKHDLTHTSNENKIIQVGITHGLNQEFWAEYLLDFSKKYPLAQIVFKVGTPNQLKAWIQDKTIEFALTISRDIPKNYQYLMLYEGQFCFIRRPKYDPQKDGVKFILTENWPEVLEFREQYFKKYRKNPDVKYVVESWNTIRNFVEHGHGVGLVPDFYLLKKSKVQKYEFKLKKNPYFLVALFEKNSYLDEVSYELASNFKKYLNFEKESK